MVVDKKSKYLSVTPTVDTNVYAIGDRVGSLMTLSEVVDASSDACVLKSFVVIDSAAQSSALDFLFFSGSPTIASADNAALDIADAQMVLYFVGRVVVAAADYTALAANTVAVKNDLEMMMRPDLGSKDLYCLIQSRGTPTYTAATSITVKFLLEQY